MYPNKIIDRLKDILQYPFFTVHLRPDQKHRVAFCHSLLLVVTMKNQMKSRAERFISGDSVMSILERSPGILEGQIEGVMSILLPGWSMG